MFNQTQNILIEHINHCKLETNMNILAENHNETSRFNVSNINGSIVSEKDIEDIELRANSLTKLVESASMYSEAAKKVNPIGLQLNLLKEDTEPEQKSRKEEFDKVSKSEDTKETADYINFCNVAKRNIGSKNIVLVNSWNNYQKGTNLEPTEENKSEFLKITRNQFKK